MDAPTPANKSHVIRQYSRQAHLYAKSATLSDAASLSRLAEVTDVKPGDRLLDVATGAGFSAFSFADHCRSVVGSDLTLPMLLEARRGAEQKGIRNLFLAVADAEHLAFRSGSFDVTVCRFAAHHFPDVPAFLREARRVTRPGGTVVVADSCSIEGDAVSAAWLDRVERLRDPSHVWNLTASEWRNAFADAGLRIERKEQCADVNLEFNDWVERGGCDGETIARLRELFDTAPRSARARFGIEEREGEIYFHWHSVILRGRVAE